MVDAPTPGNDVQDNKIWAVIGYLGILFLVPLLAKKDSPFAQYHAKQGLGLFVLGVVVGFLSPIPFIGWFLIAPLGWIFVLVLFIMGIMNAVNGKMTPLPLIGKFAEDLKL